jgi:galactonate dehydratase
MLNHTDALIGYFAEAAPNHILGSDPFNIEDLVNRMFRNDYARAGEIAMSAISTVEMACWDIVGKALDQPVYRLLGGAVRDRIKAYANGWYTVERTPTEFHAAAKQVMARGYRAVKLDPFGAGFYELERAEQVRSIELVEAVRDAVGPDVDILVEMHGRFNPATAIDIARQLEPFRPGWLEEPVPPENLAALKKAADQIHIPIATGERIHARHEFRELFELQACDVIQPDISHFGGILETKKLSAWADAYYVLVAPHNVGGAVLTAANLHLAACTTNFKIQEHFNDFAEDFVKAVAPGNPEVVDGYFALPSGPGLGVTLNHDLLAEHPRRQIFFNLFAEDWHRRQAERTP